MLVIIQCLNTSIFPVRHPAPPPARLLPTVTAGLGVRARRAPRARSARSQIASSVVVTQTDAGHPHRSAISRVTHSKSHWLVTPTTSGVARPHRRMHILSGGKGPAYQPGAWVRLGPVAQVSGY